MQTPASEHAAQAYGAGNFMALGLVLQQALIISTLVFLAILALWSQAGLILLAAGEPDLGGYFGTCEVYA